MSTQLLAVLYATLSMLGYGLSTSLSTKYSRDLSPSKLIIYRNLVTTLMTGAAIFIFSSNNTFTLEDVLFGFFIGAVGYVGYYFMVRGLETGNLGIVSSITNSRLFLATIVGVLFLNDTISPTQLMFMAIIFFGVILSSFNLTDFKRSEIFNLKSGILFALINAIVWGISVPFYSVASLILGVFLFSFVLEGTGFSLGAIHAFLRGEKIILTRKEFRENALGLLITGFCGSIGSIFINLGYITGHLGIVSTISGAVPLVTVSYGRIFYREKLRRLQYIAIAMMLAGIICLAYLGS